MTSLPASTTRHDADPAGLRLRGVVKRSVFRGTLLAWMGAAVLALACLLGGVLLIGVVDAIFVLTPMQRAAALLGVAAAVLVGAVALIGRRRSDLRRDLSAAEHIEHAAHATDQPIVRGLSMHAGGDDALTASLRMRTEGRAAQLAESVGPGRAYPLTTLGRQGRWLWLACVGWLVAGIVFPTQLLGVAQRALLPWVDTPVFSLTQLDPSWEPAPPRQGEDVTVRVEPTGVRADAVDLLRLDENGDVVERIAMTPDGQGGFSHTLRRVHEPITFRLEAHGRATRPHTITPELEDAAEAQARADADEPIDADRGEQQAGGSTRYDPEAVKAREAAGKWAGVREDIEKLLAELAELEALAQATDPNDAEVMQALAGRFTKLKAKLAELGEQLDGLQADLPADAAASLAALSQALDNAQSAQLPPMPGSASSETSDPGTPTPSQWLSQAEQASRSDQQTIGQGLGESDVPTDNGTTSGSAGDDAPSFRDPAAVGGHNEQGVTGDDGPLPDAVMQQVPPSYRALINAYFSPRNDADNE
ncbi:MAG: hypothetical protein ACE37H_12335 [Phycisphaeraceae bacterium]